MGTEHLVGSTDLVHRISAAGATKVFHAACSAGIVLKREAAKLLWGQRIQSTIQNCGQIHNNLDSSWRC